jgi:murein DD-endopeptidase MepM/ murein hydrolase activator NlpD
MNLAERTKVVEENIKSGFISNKVGQFIIGKWKEAEKAGVNLDAATRGMMANLKDSLSKGAGAAKEKSSSLFAKLFSAAKGAGKFGLGAAGAALALGSGALKGVGKFAGKHLKGAAQGLSQGKGIFGKLGSMAKGLIVGSNDDGSNNEEDPNSAKRREGSYKDFELDKKERARDKVQEEMRDETKEIKVIVAKILKKMGGDDDDKNKKKKGSLLDSLLGGDGGNGGDGGSGGGGAKGILGELLASVVGSKIGATGFKGLKSLGAGAKGLKGALGKLGPIVALATMAIGGIKGLSDADNVSGAADKGRSATGSEKWTSAMVGAQSGLTGGLVSAKSIYGFYQNVGNKVDSANRRIGRAFGAKAGALVFPFQGSAADIQITSPFGMRDDPFGSGTVSFHGGVDLALPVGTPITAYKDGQIFKIEKDHPVFGDVIVMKHDNNMFSIYAHLSVIKTAVGKKCLQEDVIGYSGGAVGAVGAGESTGPHLHFTLIKDNKLIDPIVFTQSNGKDIGNATALTPMYLGLVGGSDKDSKQAIAVIKTSAKTPLDPTATSPESVRELQEKQALDGKAGATTGGAAAGQTRGQGVKSVAPATAGARLRESPIITGSKSATAGSGGSEEINIAIGLYTKILNEQIRHDYIAEDFYKFMRNIMKEISTRDDLRFKDEKEQAEKIKRRQPAMNMGISGMPMTSSGNNNQGQQNPGYTLNEYDSIANGF